MVNLIAICVILLLVRINAAYEDPYDSLTDDDLSPFYSDPRVLQQLSKKSGRAASLESKRRGNSGENFMRFGRSDSDYDLEYDEYEAARPTRAGINNNDRFIRFGRDRSNFLRFGRNSQRNSANFLRFGRDSDGYSRRKREAEEKRGRNSNFLRFGRGNGDNFMRFGRRDEITPTIPSGDCRQYMLNSEILEQLERERLLRLLAGINAKPQGSPERLVQI